ncbi:Virilizer, N-terminal [Cinara cedri]|uniref:Virilizer, N-terminal n=1 Tax=Cinara cedri TaxID=506608 RepID=A0A5E4NMK6_9HEMI|nr:Virilizer, N-terminal [Cinara cedri]
MCKPTTEKKRLLAAETFFRSFQASREPAHSVISFETPVNFTDIKILSPSMYLTTPSGGLMLGDTDPSHFPVQFMCNNLNRPNATSYEYLGEMDYDETDRIQMTCRNNIWANKLIVNGRFKSITVVVYGSPKNPDADKIQKVDHLCTLPLFPLAENRLPSDMALSNSSEPTVGTLPSHQLEDIMAFANGNFMNSNLASGLSSYFDSNFF